MDNLRTTLELWLSGHEVPSGHPVEPAFLDVLKAFYALLLVGTGMHSPTPQPLLERLLPGLPFRAQDRPSRTVAILGAGRHELERKLRASLSPEQATGYLTLVNAVQVG